MTRLLDDRPPAQGTGAGGGFVAAARRGALTMPAPGSGATATRWGELARLGRADLPSARLAEGHADAVAILGEAGSVPRPGAAYGVWAARSGGTGAELVPGPDGPRLEGTVRFCSGAHLVDRALVVAGDRLVDVDVADPRVRPVPGCWQAAGMAASDTTDVGFDAVPVVDDALVGPPGFYTARRGFWWGGGGVAAVWLGGAAGILDAARAALVAPSGGAPDLHRLADLAELHTAVTAADALLGALAEAIDSDPGHDHRTAVLTARAAAERLCRTAVDLGPRAAGVAALTGPLRLADRVADLQVFSRQHHGGRDLAELGSALVETRVDVP